MAYGVVAISTPTVLHAQSVQGQATDTLNGPLEADTTATLQMANRAEQQDTDLLADAEIDHRFNELRREFLDDRASTIDWWLIGITVFLGLFTILVALAGIAGYLEFRRVRKQALEAVRQAQESAEEAKRFVEEIKQIRDKAHEYFQDVTAQKVDDDPGAERQAEVVSDDPEASLMDRAVARAISLQKEGEIEKAIKIWQGIAYSTEEIDNDLAARAWFSVGYLKIERGDKTDFEDAIDDYDESLHLNPDNAEAYNNRGLAKTRLGQHEDAIDDYDESLRLNPDNAVPYNNRGLAKARLGRHEDAIDDYDESLRLNPDYAKAYINRGLTKAKLDRIAEARADFEKAREIAKQAGDEKTVSLAEEHLRYLENSEDA